MSRFLLGHATHPDWRMALALAGAQIDAQRERSSPTSAPTLGWVYLTDHYGAHAGALLGELRLRWPGVAWVGATGLGIAATGVEYFDEPALALMLTDLPVEQFRVFSGAKPLGGFAAHTAQVHADPAAPDLPELIQDMSRRTHSGYLFGGLASAQGQALHIADAVLHGGLSGVAFTSDVTLVSRVTQGCQPVGPRRTISACQGNVITSLDGEAALECLLRDMKLESLAPRDALPQLRQVLVGLSLRPSELPQGRGDRVSGAFDDVRRRGAFGADTWVRHLIGLDPARHGIAIGAEVQIGMELAFCERNVQAARRDLTRICAELREELEPESLNGAPVAGATSPGQPGAASPPVGAVYVSCVARGAAHFGSPSGELAIVQQALGDVPLVGLFASGEIARDHLYGYTGVLTVFTQ